MCNPLPFQTMSILYCTVTSSEKTLDVAVLVNFCVRIISNPLGWGAVTYLLSLPVAY